MSAESKAAILADESKFQRACDEYIRKNVFYCLSSMFYQIGKDIETSSKLFDEDYDEMLSWFSQPDYEEAASYFIRESADLEQLEEIAEQNGYWDDLLEGIGYNVYVSTCEETDDDPDSLEDWLEAQDRCHEEKFSDALREEVLKLLTSPESYQQVCEEYSLDVEYNEIYEHWLVSSDFGEELKTRGYLVFDFQGMTVYGRGCTGQAISLDWVTQDIVKGIVDYAWVWDCR